MPFPIPNVILAHASDIRTIPERTWNHIVMKIQNLGGQQLLVVWPRLDAALFDVMQNVSAQLQDVFVPSMEWAGVPAGQDHQMIGFMAGHMMEHCAAAKLAVLQDFNPAYEAFHQMGVPHLTPAALSHYLHAISLNARHKATPLPYGQNVIRALWKCQTAKDDLAALAVQENWRQLLIDCHLADADGNVSDFWDLSGFLQYQSLLKDWAGELKCQTAQIQVWLEQNVSRLEAMPTCDVEDHKSIMDVLDI